MWQHRDPLVRLRNWLDQRGLWNDDKQAAQEQRAREHVAEVVKRAEQIAEPDTADFFNTMYAELPAEVALQRDTMRTSSLGQDPSELQDVPSQNVQEQV